MIRTILVVVATLVVAIGLMLGGGAIYNLGFQHGEQFAKGRTLPGKPCECKRCRCMSQGVPGDAAGAAASPESTSLPMASCQYVFMDDDVRGEQGIMSMVQIQPGAFELIGSPQHADVLVVPSPVMDGWRPATAILYGDEDGNYVVSDKTNGGYVVRLRDVNPARRYALVLLWRAGEAVDRLNSRVAAEQHDAGGVRYTLEIAGAEVVP